MLKRGELSIQRKDNSIYTEYLMRSLIRAIATLD